MLQTNFYSSLVDQTNYFPSSVFPSEATRETEKQIFSLVEDFTPFWWHSEIKKPVGIVKWRSTVKIKRRGPTSLAFMLLVPGAD